MPHTPKPWKAIVHPAVDGGDYIQILAGSWDIAHNRHTARDWEEELANGILMAAAPELLDACGGLVRAIRDAPKCSPHQIFASEVAEAAIAKAEGKP